MSEFIHFNDVQVDREETWRGRKILSFDVDWATDDQLACCLDLVETAGVKVCVFVTHDTPMLVRLRRSPHVELAIHPNFNPLVAGTGAGRSPADVIRELSDIVPNANVLRSHSMTTSGRWLGMYKDAGIRYLSNYFMYGVPAIVPFHQLNGLVEIPVYFADDAYLYLNDKPDRPEIPMGQLTTADAAGIRVYNFHPIHVAGNNRSYKAYSGRTSNGATQARDAHDSRPGARDILCDLIGIA